VDFGERLPAAPCGSTEWLDGKQGPMTHAHYNGRRPHRALQLRPPRPDHPAPNLDQQQIRRQSVLGSLISEYERLRLKAQVSARSRVLDPGLGGAAICGADTKGYLE
jgi:hypothetical protein